MTNDILYRTMVKRFHMNTSIFERTMKTPYTTAGLHFRLMLFGKVRFIMGL